MAEIGGTPGASNAFCLACGYSLRQLTVNRCPECGREFDPADPRTMSMIRPLRAWQRWILRPIGWPTALLAVFGAVAMGYVSRWPSTTSWTPEPWSVLRHEFRWPSAAIRPLTLPDIVFYTAAGCFLAFGGLSILRRLARLLVPRGARHANAAAGKSRARRITLTLAVAMWVWCTLFGWQQRIGERWMVRVLNASLNPPQDPWPQAHWYYSTAYDYAANHGFSVAPPVELSREQMRSVLTTGITALPNPAHRLAALALLIDSDGKSALPDLIRAASRENDTELLAWQVRLIGIMRDPATAQLLIDRLRDSRPGIRAAAADAIGILRRPTYAIHVDDEYWIRGSQPALDSKPSVGIGHLVSTQSPRSGWSETAEHDLLDDPPVAVDPSVRPILERMMIEGPTSEEREAAARTLVAWPPDGLQLRIAEWGVWINNGGTMSLAGSIVDEIPPFVCTLGNRLAEFESYFRYPSIVTKPIVHLTSNVATAADIEVRIRAGRPWFAYPKPDDFSIGNERTTEGLPLKGGGLRWAARASTPSPSEFDNLSLKPLLDCREGYPWLLPHHRVYSSQSTGFGGDAAIYNLGVRWQSLIVSPVQAGWMTPPSVPADSKYQWWTALRDVPCSWVSSRGETERFLYYDGPTRAWVPIMVKLHADRLQFGSTEVAAPIPDDRREPAPRPRFEPLRSDANPAIPEHEGLYIDVHSGVARGQYVPLQPASAVPLESDLPLSGDALVHRLRQMLVSYGLTQPEAEGLIQSWSPHFFHAEGRRFLLRMSAHDYDAQCPMQVRPMPTAVVRLGLVLTEFDAKPAERPR